MPAVGQQRKRLTELLGEDHVLYGSDYPHPEGLAEPGRFMQDLDGIDDNLLRKFMGGNLARLMNMENVPVTA